MASNDDSQLFRWAAAAAAGFGAAIAAFGTITAWSGQDLVARSTLDLLDEKIATLETQVQEERSNAKERIASVERDWERRLEESSRRSAELKDRVRDLEGKLEAANSSLGSARRARVETRRRLEAEASELRDKTPEISLTWRFEKDLSQVWCEAENRGDASGRLVRVTHARHSGFPEVDQGRDGSVLNPGETRTVFATGISHGLRRAMLGGDTNWLGACCVEYERKSKSDERWISFHSHRWSARDRQFYVSESISGHIDTGEGCSAGEFIPGWWPSPVESMPGLVPVSPEELPDLLERDVSRGDASQGDE